MQLSELRTLLGELQQLDLDNQAGASPSTSALDAQLNRAMRWLAEVTHCCYDNNVSLTLVDGTAKYSIQATSPKMLEIDRVTIDGIPLKGVDGYEGLWTLGELTAYHPFYASYTNGRPTVAYMLDELYLAFSPTPDAAAAALTCKLAGPIIPATLTNNADEPAIPVQYHEHLAYIAAAFSSEPLLSEAESWTRVQAYNARVGADIKKLQARAKARSMKTSPVRGGRADWGGGDIVAPGLGGFSR